MVGVAVGPADGSAVGVSVGTPDGTPVGACVVGASVGCAVGDVVGPADGATVGLVVGDDDGVADGVLVGASVRGQYSHTYRRRCIQSLLSKRTIPFVAVMLTDVVPCCKQNASSATPLLGLKNSGSPGYHRPSVVTASPPTNVCVVLSYSPNTQRGSLSVLPSSMSCRRAINVAWATLRTSAKWPSPPHSFLHAASASKYVARGLSNIRYEHAVSGSTYHDSLSGLRTKLNAVGADVVGARVVGVSVGASVVGDSVVGASEAVGDWVVVVTGAAVGVADGASEGVLVGVAVGVTVG